MIPFDGVYMKMNLVEQSYDGTVFAVAYQDNGKFMVVFVNNKGTVLDELDVSEKLALDPGSKPVTGFMEPLITCAFIANDDIYLSAYHRV